MFEYGVYLKRIWASRFFWMHLALSDLRAKWRRTYIGMSWSIIQPLGLTLLLSLVFSRLFHNDVLLYLPYILSGMITWDFISATLIAGSLAFVQADPYIKQCSHPLAIYTLRLILSQGVVLLLASIALIAWSVCVLPQNINLSWFALLTFYPIICLIMWPLATSLAYVGANFRDIPHVLGLLLQALWFVSPVYFQTKMFRDGGLSNLIDYNPIYHLLQIIRAPVLEGHWPSIHNYMVCLSFFVVASCCAILMGQSLEKRVIFYL